MEADKEMVKDKIRGFMEKKDVSLEDAYFITKELNEDIYSELQDQDVSEEAEDEVDDFEDEPEGDEDTEEQMPFDDIPSDTIDLQEDDFVEEKVEKPIPVKAPVFKTKKVKVK